MWYKEALAMRRALVVYAIVIGVIAVLNAWGAGDEGGIYLTQATLGVAVVTTSILALIAGNSLGNECGDMARTALLRPISRGGYAWTVFAVDIAALFVAYVGAAAIVIATFQAAHGFAPMDLHGVSLLTCVVLPFGAVLAWYGLTTVCSVTSRGSRVVAVLIGPISYVLWLGATAEVRNVAKSFQVLCVVNPLMYLTAAAERVERQAHPNTLSMHDKTACCRSQWTLRFSTRSGSSHYSSPHWRGNARRLNSRCTQC